MIYLDHAATSPLDPRVLEAMLPVMREMWGNPSSPHVAGRNARAAVDGARSTIAHLLGVQPHEVVFTASGSEGNSLALFGFCEKWIADGKKPGRVISLAVEHDCSIKALQKLKRSEWDVVLLPVSREGLLEMDVFERALTEDTALVSIQRANNEIGTLQPVEEVAALCKQRGIVFHCDAVQGMGLAPLPTQYTDMMTVAAHKFYGPKGIGVLVVKDGVQLAAQILGGGQEWGLRAGTENTAAIVGMAAALELALAEEKEEAARLAALRDAFEARVLTLPGVSINGASAPRLPNFSNVRFAGRKSDTLIIQLDAKGICVSGGAACASGAAEPSHVLLAMGRTAEESDEVLRFSFGRGTTQEDIDATINALASLL